MDRFRADVKRELEAVENSLEGEVNVNADVNTSAAMASFDRFMARLRAKAAKGVTVNTNFSGLGGGGGFGGSALASGFASPNMLVNVAKFAAIAGLIAPALALATGLLATIPALISAIAVPIAALALGFDGIKKAAETLAPEVKALKEVMTQKFQDVFTPVFDKLRGIFPTLMQSLPRVAESLGTIAQAFVDTITSGSGLKKIEGIIGNIARTISTAAPGVSTFTDGMLGLAEGVSKKFPAVSEWFNQAGDSFANWVEKVSSDGSLDRAMSTLGGTLKTILDTVGDIAKTGFEWLSDPEFGARLQQFVKDIQTLTNVALPMLKGFFEQISDIIHGLALPFELMNKNKDATKLGGKGQDVATEFGAEPPEMTKWEAFEAGVNAIRERIRASFASVLAEVSIMAARIPAAISTSWSTISGTVSTVFGTVVGVVRAKVGEIVGTVQSMGGQIAGAAASAWAQVVSATQTALAQVVSAVVSGGAQIIAEVGSWPGKVGSALAGLADVGMNAGRALVQGLISGIGSMIGAAVAKAQELMGAVRNLFPNSPAKEGPFSGSGWVDKSGASIGKAFADGIGSQTSTVVSSAQSLMEAAQGAFDNSQINAAMQIPKNFAEATIGQFASDIGISGKGALSEIAKYGVEFGSQFVFNVASADEAMAIKQNQVNKQALQYTSR